jgi:hypothetical protein
MHRYGIEEEVWFEAARTGLERRGFTLRVQPRSIIIDKEGRLPRIVGSARELLEFADRQGMRIDEAAYALADRYGDSRSDLSGRASASPFETPPEDAVARVVHRFETGKARPPPAPAATPPANPPGGERATVQTIVAENRVLEARCAQLEKQNATLAQRGTALEQHCAALEAETQRLARSLAEAEKQRDLYQMTIAAAEEKLRGVQAEYETVPMAKGADKRFDQLRRFLARELHPDLAAAGTMERQVREALFKRIWAKIEQLQ